MNEKLDRYHIAILVYMIQSGVVMFSLPGLLAEHFGANGWIMLFPASLLVMVNIFLISLVYKMGNGESIFNILENALSKWLLFPFYFFLAALWCLLGTVVGKQYVLIFQMISFPTTSPMLLKVLTDILAYLLVIKGLYNISKAATVFFLLTIWMVGLELFHIPELELARYTTFILKDGSGWVIGMLDIFTAFLGYELVILFFPFVKANSKFIRAVYWGNLITTLVYLSVSVVSFGFYHYKQIANMLFPVIDLLSYIKLPFIERIENLLYALFFLKTLVTSVLYFWAATEAMKRVFKKINDKLVGFMIVAIGFIFSFYPKIISDVNQWLQYGSYIETGVAFCLPLLVLMILLIKNARRGERA